MEEYEPLLPTFSDPLPFTAVDVEDEEEEDEPRPIILSAAGPSSCSATPLPPPRRIFALSRTRTAPAIATFRHLILRPNDNDTMMASKNKEKKNKKKKRKKRMPKPGATSSSVLKKAAILLVVYLCMGVLVYSTNPNGFSGDATHPAVDALYFCIVTLCTIGYGDITPLTPATKLYACAFVLVGFGLIDYLLAAALDYMIDAQEALLIATAGDAGVKDYIYDAEKRRMRIRTKVGLAIGVVVLCIGAGAGALYLLEGLGWTDALYLAVMSVTTVRYGDKTFRTMGGRVFASFWLLVSTLAVARAFLYLAEARIDSRNRRIVNRVLHRDLTVEDLLAADLNQNGFISKSEYVIYKLKEMGKVGEDDILLICNQFNKLDRYNTGKITFPDLLNASR